jgi:hypothetical protein
VQPCAGVAWFWRSVAANGARIPESEPLSGSFPLFLLVTLWTSRPFERFLGISKAKKRKKLTLPPKLLHPFRQRGIGNALASS